ncbi:MAG TPA: CdaR family protein [Vicinamibacterales bacterium]|nr:CdaR family protein [Vicinamibacterales bacterium]
MTWPFKHLGLKLLSVGLAVLLWMTVSGEEIVERGLRVPLELQQFPAGLELGADVPTTVDVRVRGGSGMLSRVSAGDVIAVIDLRTARPGRRLFPLTPEQVRVPFGVEVVQVMPSAIAMAFEPSASRQVPVVPAVDGRPAPGYMVGAMSADPSTVEVIGPESAVKRASEAMTEPVSVAGARGTVSESVTIGVLDPALRLKNPRPGTVTVQIVAAPHDRMLRNRPVHLRNLSDTLVAEAAPTVVDVTIRGTREALTRVDPDDVVAYIDLAGLGAGEYTLTAHADASEDAGVVRLEPPSVKVRIASAKR